MLPGVLALLERSLRIDARAWGPHLARFGLATAIYLTLISAVEMSGMFGAPGLRFFRNIVYLDLFFISLLGVTFFSTSVTEEREEDTLGLMLMAGINPLGILLGKSGGRLIQAFLLMAVQYPFTLLAITLGGITQAQIRHTYVSILAYVVMLAGLGLLSSTLSRRNRDAASRLTIVVLAYWILPMVCAAVVRKYSSPPYYNTEVTTGLQILNWIAQSCAFFEVDTAMTAGADEPWWTPQVISNTALGALGFMLSWLCFDSTARAPVTEVQTRGMVSTNRKLFAAGSPWKNPIEWKDFYFVTGGKAAFLIRTVLYISVYFLIAKLTQELAGWSMSSEETTGFYLTLVMFLGPIDAAWILSRSFGDELRSQTLAPLMLLPIPSGRILYSKMRGSLLGWLPAPACMIFGIYFLPNGTKLVYEFFEHPGPTGLIVTHLLLLPHLAALLSLFVRWGALAIAIGLSIGSLFITVSIIELMITSIDDPVWFMASCGIVVLCLGCHIGLRLRVDHLASR